MRRTHAYLILTIVGALAALLPAQVTPDAFETDFTGRTMRVDFFHTGTATEEVFSLDRVVSDGPWPGSRSRLVDGLNLGKYRFEVADAETGQVLYSRGFSSIYGEWETTSEAREVHRTFHESLRFPWPRRPVEVVVKKRGKGNAFAEIWKTAIDPNSRFVVPADVSPGGTVWTLFENGHPASKADLLILGDGYTAGEAEKFQSDARRLTEKLFAKEPFRSRKKDFNVRALAVASAESGVTRPHAGVFRRTPLSAHYSSFDSERYVLTYDNRAVRNIASSAPYDFLMILVNERTYGGGGIYNLYATTSADNAFSDYVFIHEFGHHFADLADEYYTSPVAYETGAAERPEPWMPNVTALHDPAALKWKDLVKESTPLPTPWEKAAYEKLSRAIQEKRRQLRAAHAPEEALEELFQDEQHRTTELLAGMEHSGAVGAFEGANYEAQGYYRPSADCIMFTRNDVDFCKVCQRAITRVIDLYSRP